jgi:hypothetical protein
MRYLNSPMAITGGLAFTDKTNRAAKYARDHAIKKEKMLGAVIV